jgi:hypothetical protein
MLSQCVRLVLYEMECDKKGAEAQGGRRGAEACSMRRRSSHRSFPPPAYIAFSSCQGTLVICCTFVSLDRSAAMLTSRLRNDLQISENRVYLHFISVVLVARVTFPSPSRGQI